MRLPRVRLSVRALMIVVLVIGGGLGWVVHRAHVQRDAVAAIQKVGGRVYYDWEWDGDFPQPNGGKPSGPKWLVDALGPDYFGHPAAVNFAGRAGGKADDALMAEVASLGRLESLKLNGCRAITDAGLARLEGLTGLTNLDLSFTGASGAGLKHVSGMTRLKRLELPFGRINDADLVHLKGLTALEWLQGARAQPDVTDAGLASLKGLVNLQTLSIHSLGITSAGLASLRDMKRLRTLNLHHCGVTDLTPIRHLTGLTTLSLISNPVDDAGLTPVRDLTRLTHLYLDGTRITDAGLAHLAGLSNLYNLSLKQTAIGDAGLVHLAGLNKVTLLFLEGTQVTDAGLAHLEGLRACEQVVVSGTVVTDGGIKEARQKRPRTRFFRVGL